jgi:hypothetical protein
MSRIWVAAVDHRHGTNLLVAASEDDMLAQLADYCRGSWHEIFDWVWGSTEPRGTEPPPDMPDREVVTTYFQAQAERGDEWHVGEDFPWPDDDPVRVAARKVIEAWNLVRSGVGDVGGAIRELDEALQDD